MLLTQKLSLGLSPFWDVMKRRLVVANRRFVTAFLLGPLKIGLTGFPETSVNKYRTLRNNPKAKTSTAP
jgi:hypothetical protein